MLLVSRVTLSMSPDENKLPNVQPVELKSTAKLTVTKKNNQDDAKK